MALLHAETDRRALRLGLATIAVVVFGSVFSALAPLALKSLVDAVDPRPRANEAYQAPSALACGVAYLLLLLAGRALADIRPMLIGYVQQHLHTRLAQRFFDHVLRLPLASLIRQREGELQHRLDLAVVGTQLTVTHLAGGLLPVVVALGTMGGVLVHLGQPALVAVFGVAALAHLAIFSTSARRMADAAQAASAASLEMHARLGEGLSHLETLRCFAAEAQARRDVAGVADQLERRWLTLHRLNAASALAASGTFGIAMAACLLAASGTIGGPAMSPGGVVLATMYALQMVQPLESLGLAARDLSRALGYFRPLLELLQEPPSDDMRTATFDAPLARRTGGRAASVRLENLHFGYDAGRPVLEDVTIEVPAGSTTAIVGRSGSGKSSLARLLMRLHAPQRGRILLDGQAIDTIAVADLRGGRVGLVPQDTTLLHDTIAANIALGSPTASEDDIRRAVRDARLEAFVERLPQGLDTPVGHRGMALSGGERQRIGIARALLRQPGLYLLDEPTSMLDSRTESEIQEVLRTLSARATTIVIAHRLSTIVGADEIVVLDDGRVRERGRHAELLARNGLYARMWHYQMATGTSTRRSTRGHS